MISTEMIAEYHRLSLLLMFRYGFFRWGAWIPAIMDDAIYPNYVRPDICIMAGWDNWLGYYFLASNAKADRFLRKFYEKHCGK